MQGGLPPLLANVVAFHVAFAVSYLGHRRLTFADQPSRTRDSLPRFLTVAYGSFALNEALYAVLLTHTRLDRLAALAIVLVAVAVVTYVSSRFWAFRRTR